MIREDVATRLSEGDPLDVASTRGMLMAVGKNVFAFVGSHRKCRVDRDFEPQFQRAIEGELTDFLSPNFGHCTAMLVASALVGSAMNWRHQAPKSPAEPIVTNIVDILVDGIKKKASVSAPRFEVDARARPPASSRRSRVTRPTHRRDARGAGSTGCFDERVDDRRKPAILPCGVDV